MALTKVGKEGITGISNSSNATVTTIDSSENTTFQCTAGSSNHALQAYHPTSTSSRTIAKFQSNVGGTQEDKVTILCDGKVGIGTTPDSDLHVIGDGKFKSTGETKIRFQNDTTGTGGTDGSFVGVFGGTDGMALYNYEATPMRFFTSNAERMRIDSNGDVMMGKTTSSFSTQGFFFNVSPGQLDITCNQNNPLRLNRVNNDGVLTSYQQDGSEEGTVSVSGGTVSYNGGHLSRWSRLLDGSKPPTIFKGTVMSNLDDMIVWRHDAADAVVDDDGNEIEPARDAYTEDNEQLNHTKVSDAEGDIDVAGVFVAWDDRDNFNDFFLAMTGDMVIRIAQGTTVARGDLLMSAGDGTAKPQTDDIVRSKTIAKVTSTTKSHTYDDGSYLVPCVLMAC